MNFDLLVIRVDALVHEAIIVVCGSECGNAGEHACSSVVDGITVS